MAFQHLTDAERLRGLSEATRAFAETTGDYRLLLETIARRTAVLTGCHCGVGMVSADGLWLERVASYDPDPAALALLRAARSGARLSTAAAASSAQVVRTGQSLLAADFSAEKLLARADPSLHAGVRALHLRSLAKAPLRAHGKVIGLVSIVRHGAGAPPLGQAEVDFLEAIAEHAGLALHNAQLLAAAHSELSERKRAEQALRASEHKFRSYIEHAPLAVFVADGAGRYLEVNEAACALVGFSAEELLGMSVAELLAPEDLAAGLERFGKAVSTGMVEALVRLRHKRLAPRLVSIRAVRLATDRVLAFCLDVTERREADARLAAERERLAVTLQSIGDAVIATDEAARVTLFNGVAEKLTGVTAAEALGRPLDEIFDIVNEESRARVPSPVERVLRDGATVGLGNHTALISRDGSVRPITDSAAPIRDASGQVAGVVLVFRDQTEEHRRQQTLRESEERYRGLVEQSLAGTFIIQDGRFRWGSQRLAEIFGYATPEELTAVPSILDLCAPEHRERLMVRVARRLDGEPGRDWLHFTGLRRDGQRIELQAHSRQVTHQGRPALIGLILDVTEGLRAQEEALRSQIRYRQLFDNSPLAKWLYDPPTLRFLEVNQAALDLYGYTREEFLQLEVKDLRPPEEYTTLAADLAHGMHFDGLFGVRRHWKKDRTVIEVEVTGQNFLNGASTARLVTAQDVTVRRRTEAALRESEEKFRQLAETIHEVFWIRDVRKDRILYVSPGYQTIWGRPAESVLADPMSWSDSIHPEDRARVVEAARTKQLDGTYDEVYRIRRPDGSLRWVRDRAFPVKSGGAVERVVGIAEDVTELRQTELQLRQSQKMEAFGQLAGGVAHDFNNLLTVILSSADELGQTLGAGDPRADSLEALAGAARRAASLTRQLLVFSRREVIAPRVLDLNEVVSGVGKMLRRLLGEDLQLLLELAPGLRRVRADTGHVEQLLMNLAVNARDAMPGGGRLTVTTADVVLGAEEARAVAGGRPGAFVRLSVGDTGCGMTPEVRARIFEPFFTTKPVGRGTGLGLATVFGIVAKSEGFLDVQSVPGAGSTFSVYLPALEAAPREAAAPLPAAQRTEGTERVLLVEDEPSVRRIAVRALTSRGYKVMEAADGEKALAVAQQQAGRIDLLVTDVVMPNLSGPELVARLQAESPDLKVLYMSGYADDAMAHHGITSSGAPFLQKPFTPSLLVAKVRAVLDGGA